MVELKNKKILITGGAGFIGKHVINNLIEKRNVPRENIFVPLIEKYDLRKMEDCQRVIRNQDIVIHLAAVTGDIEFHRLHPGRIFYDNGIMGIQLMEAARLAGIEKFVGIGSVAAYPESAPVPYKEDNFWSGYPARIHVPYSFAKKMLLVQGQAYREQYGFNVIHLLLTNVYGPGAPLQNGYVVPSIIEKIIRAKKSRGAPAFIEVWGTGRPIRDLLFAEDAAEGIILATERYDKPEPVNIASGVGVSIKDLVNLICRLMDFKGEIRWDNSKPDGQLKRTVDISRSKKEFGFTVQNSLETGMKKTINWYLENIQI